LLNSAANFVIAFFLSVLPEKVIERPSLARFRTDAAHVLSGIAECILGLGLFALSYYRVMDSIQGKIMEGYAAGKVSVASEADLRGAGAIAAVFGLFSPISILFFGMFIEGIIRAVAAGVVRHRHGIAPVWAVYKLLHLVRRTSKKIRVKSLIGPVRPDKVRLKMPEKTLELLSVQIKPWSDKQIVKYGEEFYILTSKTFTKVGVNHTYRYIFRPLKPGEIIRGTVVTIVPPEGSPDVSAGCGTEPKARPLP
jgi:hypothetical protein